MQIDLFCIAKLEKKHVFVKKIPPHNHSSIPVLNHIINKRNKVPLRR
ncbi:hypothetical protein HMPREF0204_12627 [Chryseobacterium gleum ATCC 35910]|uniref:Uncharacterized protein n=1 Tax=Chryseobacterium gleum ATCC 35910 TaxID=525257 RepID=A0ABN0AKJ0_CHRGE|nr:hypothetical protein HMPREF0204_12627 [Chryseobacterium gleum ATCC 35910]